MIAIVGALAYDYLKARGPLWIQRLLTHRFVSSKRRLLVTLLAVILFMTLIVAPYDTFRTEREGRIKAEDDVRALKAQLNALSPVGQSTEITRLNSIIQKLQARADEEELAEWPPLSEDQIEEWTTILAPRMQGIKVLFIHWGAEVKALRLFRSLQLLGKSLGVTVYNHSGAAEADKINVENIPGGLGVLFAELFRKAGYPSSVYDSHVGEDTTAMSIWIPAKAKPQP
ncbi:hypothetical protein BH20VER1_BH20VER1_08180 [soil metagenome]